MKYKIFNKKIYISLFAIIILAITIIVLIMHNSEEEWAFTATSSVCSTPVVDRDGNVFVAYCDGNVYALDASSGIEKWKFSARDAIYSDVIVSKDHDLYFTDITGILYCLNTLNGLEKWNLPIHSSDIDICADSIGHIYISSDCIYNISTLTGQVFWKFGRVNTMFNHICIGRASLYVASVATPTSHSKIFSLNSNNGTQRWQVQADCLVLTADKNDMIFIQGGDYNIYALNSADATIKWQFQLEDPTFATIQPNEDKTVYVGTYHGDMYALDKQTGKMKWHRNLGGKITSTPTISPNSTIFVGSGVDTLYVIDPYRGSILRKLNLGSITDRLSIVGNLSHVGVTSASFDKLGTVYIGTANGSVYALNLRNLRYKKQN